VDEIKAAFDVRWLAMAALGTLGVLFMTHIPPNAVPGILTRINDKIEHIGAYGGMTALYLLALKRQRSKVLSAESLVPSSTQNSKLKTVNSRRWEVRGWLSLAILVALGMAALGAVDEWTQPFTHRTCDFWDWVADVTGITVAFAIVLAGRTIVGNLGGQ